MEGPWTWIQAVAGSWVLPARDLSVTPYAVFSDGATGTFDSPAGTVQLGLGAFPSRMTGSRLAGYGWASCLAGWAIFWPVSVLFL